MVVIFINYQFDLIKVSVRNSVLDRHDDYSILNIFSNWWILYEWPMLNNFTFLEKIKYSLLINNNLISLVPEEDLVKS